MLNPFFPSHYRQLCHGYFSQEEVFLYNTPHKPVRMATVKICTKCISVDFCSTMDRFPYKYELTSTINSKGIKISRGTFGTNLFFEHGVYHVIWDGRTVEYKQVAISFENHEFCHFKSQYFMK
jgi:hypothetical protein